MASSLARRLQRAWWTKSPASLALLPLAGAVALVDRARRLLYRIGLLRTGHVGVPVIVVGNLIVGGAGKTPAVLAIVRMLRERGWHPGIVSRGHGRRGDVALEVQADTDASSGGDEPLLLRLRSGVPVSVGRDRVAAARLLRARHPEVDIIVSDDGLQHLRLHRDVQVIVFDDRGVGNGHRLPAGPLREPVPRHVPPRSLVLYNAAAPSTPLPGHGSRRRLGGVVPLAQWWAGVAGDLDALHALRGRPLTAAAGIARPERFFAMLRDAGLEIAEIPLPDHDPLTTLPWPADATEVVVTEKDAVKLRPDRIGVARVWVATLDFLPDAGFEPALTALLPSSPER